MPSTDVAQLQNNIYITSLASKVKEKTNEILNIKDFARAHAWTLKNMMQ